MTAFDHRRAFIQCAAFLATLCAIAISTALIAPASDADVPAWLGIWISLVSMAIPSVDGYASFVSFGTQTRVTLAVMWTLLPIATWWVIRGDWVVDPNMEQIRRRPWLPVALSLIFAAMVAWFAIDSPSAHAPLKTGFYARVMGGAARSPAAFGVYAGFTFSALALSLGSLPRMFRATREALRQNAA